MVDIIIVWSAFAIATCIVSIWRLYKPTWDQLPDGHSFKDHPKVIFVTWCFLVVIMAPLILPIIFSDEYQQAYIKGFLNGSA